MGIYPAVDPLDSTSRALSRDVVATSTMKWRRRCRRSCNATKTYATSSPSWGWTSSPTKTRSPCGGGKLQQFLSQPFFVAEQFTGPRQVRPSEGNGA